MNKRQRKKFWKNTVYRLFDAPKGMFDPIEDLTMMTYWNFNQCKQFAKEVLTDARYTAEEKAYGNWG